MKVTKILRLKSNSSDRATAETAVWPRVSSHLLAWISWDSCLTTCLVSPAGLNQLRQLSDHVPRLTCWPESAETAVWPCASSHLLACISWDSLTTVSCLTCWPESAETVVCPRVSSHLLAWISWDSCLTTCLVSPAGLNQLRQLSDHMPRLRLHHARRCRHFFPTSSSKTLDVLVAAPATRYQHRTTEQARNAN